MGHSDSPCAPPVHCDRQAVACTKGFETSPELISKMNCMNLMIILHICIMCLWLACEAKPAKGGLKLRNSKGKKSLRQRAMKRQRSNARRLRMLRKMLKRLTPDDVMQLAKSKKDEPYSYGQYVDTHATSIKVKNVPEKETEKQKGKCSFTLTSLFLQPSWGPMSR